MVCLQSAEVNNFFIVLREKMKYNVPDVFGTSSAARFGLTVCFPTISDEAGRFLLSGKEEFLLWIKKLIMWTTFFLK